MRSDAFFSLTVAGKIIIGGGGGFFYAKWRQSLNAIVCF
ncbi:hypothetical protein D1AOALGA4SA_10106 [Olavius algarvensis Delta 1 endosymbiont]|nr:hypothetical protein D1AOALGA4SA_10106 [Olavius algarvensis Delta 1 endosymbiont]